MNYNIIAVPGFRKDIKRLSKRYSSLKTDLAILFDELEKNPKIGVPIGKNCFKIRLAITSKGKGKSAGARVITNFVIRDSVVYLLTIYDKSELENISDQQLEQLLKAVP